MKKLPDENERRKENIEYFKEKIEGIEGIEALKTDPGVTYPAHYYFAGKFITEKFEGIKKETFFKAAAAEGIPEPGFYPFPLYLNPALNLPSLGNPGNPLHLADKTRPIEYDQLVLPESEKAINEGFWIMHEAFLGTKQDMDDMASAIAKIRENASELKDINV